MRSQVEERTCRQMFLDRSTVLDYSGLGCQCRLNRGGILFRRTRYQQGSLRLEERKKGSAVWVYRWWENDITGKPIRRKVQLGCLERYPNESAACAAADALRLTINNQSKRNNLQKTTVNTLWEHYCREELPLKEISTQDAYLVYANNWILPRWGNLLLEEIKTIEVERWLRAAEIADGTKAKIKCVMSAVFSHAVRWEFCGHNPISSGVPVGTGGQRGPSTGVRVSAKRQKSPLVLSPEEVILGLAQLEFRDQILVFLDGALGIRQGELGALHWLDCDFNNMNFSVQHSYYWRRGGHLKSTKTEAQAVADASDPEAGLAGVEVTKSLQPAARFRLPFETAEGEQTARLSFGVEEKNPTGVRGDRHRGRGVAHFSAHGGLHVGRDGRTPTHDPRLLASQQPARHQQVPSGNDKEQAYGTGKARGCHPAWGCAVGKQIKPIN